jgi:hypothetical protein
MFENFGNFFGGSNDPQQATQPVTRSSLQRKKRMAEMLLKGGQPDDPTRMAGRYVVPISPLSTLVKTASAIMGQKMQGEVDADTAALKQSDIDNMIKATSGTDPRKMAQYLMSSDNPQFQEMGAKLLGDQLKQKDLIKINDTLYDPNTKEAVFTAPEEQMSPYQRGMLDLENKKFGLQQQQMQQKLNPANGVNPVTAKAFASSFAKELGEVNEQANKAQGNIASLNELNNLIQQYPTGPGAARTAEFNETANKYSMGAVPLSDTTKAFQRIDALSNQLTLDLSAMMKGPSSDKDIAFLKDATPSKMKDPAANKKIIEFSQKLAERKILQNEFYNQAAAEGKDVVTIKKEWADYMRNNPIVDEIGANTETKSSSPSGGAKTISSDAEYNALPSGATFVGPDGKTRRKP